MSIIQVAGFAGENRALHPKLLPPTVGVSSLNQKPGRGDFRPWKQPTTVATVPGGRQTIYRMGRDVASDSQYWLSWTGLVHAVRAPGPTDTSEWTCYSGDGEPKITNTEMALAAPPYPTTNRPLGLPAPTAAPSVAVGDPGTVEAELVTIFYLYTYVNDWGWESAPSPVSAQLSRYADGTTTIGDFTAPPAGNYNVNRIRVYRTATGATGATDFYFLREISYGTATTTDDNRALGELLPTTGWLPAPGIATGGAVSVTEQALSYLTSMWNGMLAGISGDSIRFCEPFTPYAWPVAYDIVPPDSKPLALGVFGQSLLVLTTGRPLLVAGSTPEAMDQQPIEMPQACVAPRSAVSMGNGVAWASEDGLCWFGSGGGRLLTAGLMTREDWQALAPSTMTGKWFEGLYFGTYDNGSGRKGFLIDPQNPTGIFFLSTAYEVMHFDELRDQLYVLNSTNVQKWDAGSAMTATFRSKVFEQPEPENFACMRVIADAYPVTVRVDAVDVLAADVTKLVNLRPGVYTAPVSTALRYAVSVPSRNLLRLPADYLASAYQIEIEGTAAVQAVVLATSTKELTQQP